LVFFDAHSSWQRVPAMGNDLKIERGFAAQSKDFLFSKRKLEIFSLLVGAAHPACLILVFFVPLSFF